MAARAERVARVTKLENERPAHGKRGDVLLVITGFPIPFHRFSVAPISHLPHAHGDARFTREHRYVAPESRKNLPADGQGSEADGRVFRHKSGRRIAWPAIRFSHTMRTGLAAVQPSRKVGHTRVGTSRSSDPEEIGGIAAGDPSTRPAHHALATPACPVDSGTGPIVRRVQAISIQHGGVMDLFLRCAPVTNAVLTGHRRSLSGGLKSAV